MQHRHHPSIVNVLQSQKDKKFQTILPVMSVCTLGGRTCMTKSTLPVELIALSLSAS